MTERTRPSAHEFRPTVSAAGKIASRVVSLLSQYTGRGPTRARTTMNTNVIVVVVHDVLTQPERNLVAAGEIEPVLAMRRRFQEIMREPAIAAIEEITGRTVTSLMSDLDPADDVGVQVFVLQPLPETNGSAVGEARGDDRRPDGTSSGF